MTTKEHKKHTKLTRPDGGKYHRLEWSFIGAPCDRIKEVVTEINKQIGNRYKIAYMDDDHNVDDTLPLDFHEAYQYRISHYNYAFKSEDPSSRFKSLFQNCDGVFLNGNHYTAQRQVVIINQKKKESLSKKLDRLTNVAMILYDVDESALYDFLKTDTLDLTDVPAFPVGDLSAIGDHFKNTIRENIAPLHGLFFAGGESRRMGQDKVMMQYHGTDQLTYSKKLMAQYCEDVHLSVTDKNKFPDEDNLLVDKFVGLGPFGALLTAFQNDPNKAYLSLPCDTPLIDEKILEQLIANRNPSKLATCFHNPETGFPEPLITIWEPRAYPKLLQYLSQGYSCPRKVLINSEIEELQLDDPRKIMNINTPEEEQTVRKILKES
jgi:molybdopterin-guanine dinucleotide biosynthesis protein A